jgi:pimeloyl-ACP methyl ester carboxylesterase
MIRPDTSAVPAVDAEIVLGDGRTLAYAEWGDPAGRPVFLLHGMPGSRLFCPDVAETRVLGVRGISLDRPGYGRSDGQPGRRIVDGAGDVAALATALGIGRYAVVGWSSGGPYALACGARSADRVDAVASVAGDAPLEEFPDLIAEVPAHVQARIEGIRRGQDWAVSELEERIAPYAATPDQVFDGAGDDAGPDAALRAQPAVGAALRTMMREAFRTGAEGFRDDWIATYTPWGFRLEDVRVPVRIWRGDADALSSEAHSRHLAAGIPGARLSVIAGGGHLIVATEWRAILARLNG